MVSSRYIRKKLEGEGHFVLIRKKPMFDKEEWMRQLKVGDVVCDCRYKHSTIAKIEEEWGPPSMPLWLRDILHAEWMPNKICNYSYDIYYWMCEKLNRTEMYDKTLTMEDGAVFSVMPCCDPADHDADIHAEAIEAVRKWNEDDT